MRFEINLKDWTDPSGFLDLSDDAICHILRFLEIQQLYTIRRTSSTFAFAAPLAVRRITELPRVRTYRIPQNSRNEWAVHESLEKRSTFVASCTGLLGALKTECKKLERLTVFADLEHGVNPEIWQALTDFVGSFKKLHTLDVIVNDTYGHPADILTTIACLPNITDLSIEPLWDTDLALLPSNLPLKRVTLRCNCFTKLLNFSDFLERFQGLEHLELYNSYSPSGDVLLAGFKDVQLPNLKSICLTYCDVGDTTIAAISQTMPNLRSISVDNGPTEYEPLTGNCISTILNMEYIAHVDIASVDLSTFVYTSHRHLPRIKTLKLPDSALTDKAMVRLLEVLPNLTELCVCGDPISNEVLLYIRNTRNLSHNCIWNIL